MVEDPEAPALRSHNQIGAFDGQICNGHNGQVELKRLPVRAVVERDVETAFCAGVEQAWPLRIGADDAREMILSNPVGYFLPGVRP